MKKIVCLAIIACFLVGCGCSYYIEGRVETLNVTGLMAQSAGLNGRVELNTEGSRANPTVTERGFVLRREGMASRRISAGGREFGNFIATAINLLPNTTYSVQAFATIRYRDNYGTITTTFYGNIIEFTTR